MIASDGALPLGSNETDAAPKRLLMTIHRISFGGADRIAVLLANAFAAAGMETRIAILRDGGEGESSVIKLLHPRVELRRAGPPMGSRHRELLRGYSFIRREIATWRPDIVLASSNNMGLVTGLAARHRKDWRPRLVLKFTNPVIRPRDWGAPRLLYRKLLYRFVLGRYDRVLVLSDGERATLARLYPRYGARLRTVGNPYVTDAMLASERVGSELPGRARLITSGRMMPQKRLDRLVETFARLSLPGAELVILGDGPLRPALERQVRQLGLSHRVHLAGFVEDVIPWMREADLFVLSSDYEGLPAVILEALACGLPVVTTDCFDAAHVLLDGAPQCFVVPRTDPFALARSIEHALGQRPDPAELRRIALPYRFETAMREHVAAIVDLARN